MKKPVKKKKVELKSIEEVAEEVEQSARSHVSSDSKEEDHEKAAFELVSDDEVSS